MSYVAIKGGANAISAAESLLDYLRCEQGDASEALDVETITKQLRFLNSRVISEGGLYHPKLASLAIKQTLGDTLEASFALRAFRSTQPRLVETPIHDTKNMRMIRRISAAFKDISGGQMLGPSADYSLRMMRLDLLDESPEAFKSVASKWLDELPEDDIPTSFTKVLDSLREQGLLPSKTLSEHELNAFDITRQPLVFPVDRSAALATMARAETGSLLAFAYSNMRGYGDIHPTVAELRVGYVPIMLPHPITGELTEIGEVLMTECEVVAMYEKADGDEKPTFTLGYGACFGHNEVKAISMAILDRSLQKGMQDGPSNPSEDPEFVLLHIDGIDSMGFCTHYKMPHYVTFQSDMDRLRQTQKKHDEGEV